MPGTNPRFIAHDENCNAPILLLLITQNHKTDTNDRMSVMRQKQTILCICTWQAKLRLLQLKLHKIAQITCPYISNGKASLKRIRWIEHIIAHGLVQPPYSVPIFERVSGTGGFMFKA